MVLGAGSESEADGGGDLGGFFRGYEGGDEGEAEVDGGAGAARGDDAAVAHDALVGEDGGQFVRDRGVRGVATAGEQAGVVQDGGRGADGGEEFAGGVVTCDERAHGGRFAEKFHAGAAGEKKAVVGGGVGREIGEESVGFEDDLVAPGDAASRAEGGDGDDAAGAAEQIDGRDGLQLFKSLWQNGEDGGHGGRMNVNERATEGLATKSTGGAKNTDAARSRHLAIFGAGYVGAALALRALAVGTRVTALTRNAEKAAELRALGCTVVVADLATDAWWSDPALAGGADHVAVSVAGGFGGGVEGYRRSYVEGMRSVVGWGREVAARGGAAGKLIYTGSTTVYPQDGGVRVTEADPIAATSDLNACIVESERLCAEWSGPSMVLRLAGIYGPTRTHLLEQVRRGEVAGLPENHLNLIHRDDIVDAMEAAWTWTGWAGFEVFNIADEGEATKGEVAAWLAERLGVPMPGFTGQPAGGRRAITPDRIIDSSRARTVLGWTPRHRTFREGYATFVAAATR